MVAALSFQALAGTLDQNAERGGWRLHVPDELFWLLLTWSMLFAPCILSQKEKKINVGQRLSHPVETSMPQEAL